jgi:hypothetical protein
MLFRSAMKDSVDLGNRLFDCEKYPVKECLIRANGGWRQILLLYLILIPLGAVTLSGFIAAALGWLGDKGDVSKRPLLLGLWVIVILLLYILTIFLWKRGYKFASSVAIVAYEKGIETRNPSGSVRRAYSQIRAVYFGTRNQLAVSTFAVGNIIKPGAMRAAADAFQSRMTIEFADGTHVRFPLCLAYFKAVAMEEFLSHIARECPGIFDRA